jgi:CubicO group peptidase (beta-lactamase class C family)
LSPTRFALAALVVVGACGGAGCGASGSGAAGAADAAPGAADAASVTSDARSALADAAVQPDAAPAPADVSATLEPYRAQASAPAMAAAVWRGGTLIALGATGVRKLGDPTSVTTGDLWHLGSDTKAMTATLIGIYVDAGTLHFSDTIAALFPGETIDPGYRAVTLDQLLEHRGGLPSSIPSDIWNQMWADGATPGARLKAVRAMLAQPPAQTPGTYAYANAGYMVAGAALELAVGDTWEHLISQKLWRPLGMASCGFGAPGTAGQVDQPWGHQTLGDGSLKPLDPGTAGSDNPPSLGPAGTAHCSLADWGKFLALHVAGARGETTPLVRTATLQHLQTPPAGGDYAAGWAITSRDWAGGLAITHTGSNTLWYATAWLAPAKNLAFVVVSNCASPAAATQVDAAFGPLIQAYAK